MAAIPGSVRVAGVMAPTDDTDTYAVHDEIYGRGGWRTVADITARDAISSDRRRIGMPVRVLDADGEGNQAIYTLNGGITNSDWVVDAFGGEWSGAYDTSYSATDIDLTDATEFTLVEAVPYTTEGIGYLLAISTAASIGQVTVEIYDDVAKERLVITYVVDLSFPTARSTASFGFTSETVGTLYCTLYCSNVLADQIATFSLAAAITSPRGAPTVVPTPYGDGIEDDGTGKPRVALSSTGGLEFSSGKLVVKPDVTSPAYLTKSSNGLAITGVVTSSTDQSITSKKVFSSVGCIPLATSGYPTTGTYATGAEVLDSLGVKWRCILGGTSGTWMLADNVAEVTDIITYDTVLPGAAVPITIPTLGNAGVLAWLRVWAVNYEYLTMNSEVPFRARIYETSSRYGREIVWQGMGMARETYLISEVAASQVYLPVSTNDVIEVDEGLYIFDGTSPGEFARCNGRSTGNIDISESFVSADPWPIYSHIAPVTEWSMVPWVNLDGDPDLHNQIFFEIRHDGGASDAVLDFFVQARIYNFGVVL